MPLRWVLDVVAPAEPPASNAALPVEQLLRVLQLGAANPEGVCLHCIDFHPALCQELPCHVQVEVVVLHQQLLNVAEAVV